MTQAPQAGLAAAVSQVYGLAPGDFIARRNALATQAKAAGDGDLAARIKRLPKPALGVWLLNQLARHRPEQLGRVLGLSLALRQAQAEGDGDELRRLSRVRAEVMRDVLSAGRAVGAELGQAISDSVIGEAEQALRAALADQDAATALVSGQLVQLVSSTGFGGVELDAALAAPELSAGQVLAQPVLPIEPASEAGSGGAASRQARTSPQVPPVLRAVSEAEHQATGSGRTGPGRTEWVPEQPGEAEHLAEQRAADRRADEASAAARKADQALADARHQADETADRLEEIAAELSQLRDQVRDLEQVAREARKAAREADRARRRLGSV